MPYAFYSYHHKNSSICKQKYGNTIAKTFLCLLSIIFLYISFLLLKKIKKKNIISFYKFIISFEYSYFEDISVECVPSLRLDALCKIIFLYLFVYRSNKRRHYERTKLHLHWPLARKKSIFRLQFQTNDIKHSEKRNVPEFSLSIPRNLTISC